MRRMQSLLSRDDRMLRAARTPALDDLRFQALLGAAAWARLPVAIRARFSKRLAPGLAVTYGGTIVESRRSWLGWALTQLCRLVGAPLPLDDAPGLPAVVSVTEDAASGGQFWTRIYGQRSGFPQVIHSSKRFAGPTGIEEYLGRGFGIALTVRADSASLHFQSDHYFLALGGRRWRLPRWLSPGALTISHVDRGDGWFDFILALRHRWAGTLVHQVARFQERKATEGKVHYD